MNEHQNYKTIAVARRQIISAIFKIEADEQCTRRGAIITFLDLMQEGQLSELLTKAVLFANARPRSNNSELLSKSTIYNWIKKLEKSDSVSDGLRPKKPRNSVKKLVSPFYKNKSKGSAFYNALWAWPARVAERIDQRIDLAKRKKTFLPKNIWAAPYHGEKIDLVIDWVIVEKLWHLRKYNYTRSEQRFHAKILFAEVIIEYCKWLKKPQSTVLSEIADRLSKGHAAINYSDFDMREIYETELRDFTECWGIPYSMERDRKLRPYSTKEIRVIKSEYELLEKRSEIIGFMLAKNYWPLHMKTEYLENCPPNTRDIINTLRDWIDEANIPNCYDIPRGLSIYSVNQIASINRDLDFGVNILSKKGIRKEFLINDKYMSEICSIMGLPKSVRKATDNKNRVNSNYYPLL